MKIWNRKVFLCLIVTLEAIICQKDPDEGRPYEFGFTIDGQQHRHEKKDQNGIIQGEFGFITADGVYHVTVYATDENGDFKILSMRNIRISAPLDGSPAQGPISPEASKYLKKANLPQQIEPAKPKTTQQKLSPPLSVTPKTIVSTQRVPYVFTTQSTIRPACGGCGLIPTAKPGTKFTFQNPVFKDTKPSVPGLQTRFSDAPSDTEGLQPRYDKIEPSYEKSLPQNSGFKSIVGNNQDQQEKSFAGPTISKNSGVGQYRQGKGFSATNAAGFDNPLPPESEKSSQTFGGTEFRNAGLIEAGNVKFKSNILGPAGNINTPSGIQTEFQLNKEPNVNQYPATNAGNTQINRNFGPAGKKNVQTLSGADKPDFMAPRSDVEFQQPFSQGISGHLVAPPINTNGPNPLLRPQDIPKLPPVIVSDNVIHVMGKKRIDIPIKDKYPGMVDGLPDGVEVKDVTNILYKFKYTVGFHGHYEKGLKDGTKIGGYFVNGRDGISRIVTYIADENGYRPKFKFINLGLDSPDTPNEKTEKTFGLKDFEFVWYPVE